MAEDSQLLGNLKTTLLTLELKRTELLQKYEPKYRLVQDADQQIAETRKAIELAEKNAVREETTDRDPTYDWAQTELAKAKADLGRTACPGSSHARHRSFLAGESPAA